MIRVYVTFSCAVWCELCVFGLWRGWGVYLVWFFYLTDICQKKHEVPLIPLIVGANVLESEVKHFNKNNEKNPKKILDKGLMGFYSYQKMKQIFATAPQRLPSTEPYLLPPTLFSGKSDIFWRIFIQYHKRKYFRLVNTFWVFTQISNSKKKIIRPKHCSISSWTLKAKSSLPSLLCLPPHRSMERFKKYIFTKSQRLWNFSASPFCNVHHAPNPREGNKAFAMGRLAEVPVKHLPLVIPVAEKREKVLSTLNWHRF